MSASDEATPNANAIAAKVQLQLYLMTQEKRYAENLDRILAGFSEAAREQPFSHARLLSAAEATAGSMQIVVCGDGPDADGLWQAAWRTAAPGAARLRLRKSDSPPPGLTLPPGGANEIEVPTAYVCANQTCSLPLADASEFSHEIEVRRTG